MIGWGRWNVMDCVVIHSLAGLKQTIRAVCWIWYRCQEAGIEHLFTRRLKGQSQLVKGCQIRSQTTAENIRYVS